jgi:DNA-binding NarL/FixJ family response regulator
VQLFAQGLSDKEVARKLGISDLTVRKHRSNM